jgi:hypothetical protein
MHMYMYTTTATDANMSTTTTVCHASDAPAERHFDEGAVTRLLGAVAQAVQLGQARGAADAHVAHDAVENGAGRLVGRGAAARGCGCRKLGLEPPT